MRALVALTSTLATAGCGARNLAAHRTQQFCFQGVQVSGWALGAVAASETVAELADVDARKRRYLVVDSGGLAVHGSLGIRIEGRVE